MRQRGQNGRRLTSGVVFVRDDQRREPSPCGDVDARLSSADDRRDESRDVVRVSSAANRGRVNGGGECIGVAWMGDARMDIAHLCARVDVEHVYLRPASARRIWHPALSSARAAASASAGEQRGLERVAAAAAARAVWTGIGVAVRGMGESCPPVADPSRPMSDVGHRPRRLPCGPARVKASGRIPATCSASDIGEILP